MSISSEQYKTCIFEQARRAIRVHDEVRRVAYHDMLYRVLEHDGVEVDYEGYDGFRVAMEGYLNYVSDANLMTADDVFHEADFEARYDEFWGVAFAGIGIESHVTKDGSNGPASFAFTYQDGASEVYKVGSLNDESPAELNVRFYSTLDYAQKVMPYWDLQPDENTPPLNELAGNRASFVTNWGAGGLYWHYDAAKQEIEFTGEGDLKMTPERFVGARDSIGLGTVMTAIYGAGVKSLPAGAFEWDQNDDYETRTIVCLHGASDPVTLPSSSYLSQYTYLEIYCDNEAIRAGAFYYPEYVNWHPLSEWSG